MVRKAYTFLLLILIPHLGWTQGSREKSAYRDISKQRWGKAYEGLKKAIGKDSSNLPAFYLLSRWYFSPQNPAYNVDSASRYIRRSMGLWERSDDRTRDQWGRLPVRSSDLKKLDEGIDSAAFASTRKADTEVAYTQFIQRYPQSRYYQTAVEQRYQVAFDSASTANTFDAFNTFLLKYPEAPQAPAARAKHDELLFRYATRDNRLESFESFLRDNPDSPYRGVAEQAIFEISTAAGRPGVFLQFIKRYPGSGFSKRAIDILYHLLRERNEPVPDELVSDSLLEVQSLEHDYLVPVYVKDKFGMINSAGKVVLPPAYEEIDETYLCGGITEDVIVLPGKVLDRSGRALFEFSIDGIEDEGYGFLNVQANGKNTIYHKSGFAVLQLPVKDFRVLNGRLLAVKGNEGWGVLTLTGKQLVPFGYDDIDNIGEVLVFRKDGGYAISGIDTIASVANGNAPYLVTGFDEVKKMGSNILARKGQLFSAWNQKLESFIPPGRHTITPAFFGSVLQSEQGFNAFNRFGESSENFQQLAIMEPWVSARTTEGWVLYSPEQRILKSVPYDTIMLYGPFAVGHMKDGVELNLFRKPEKLLTLGKVDHIEFLPGKDSLSYLMVSTGNRKTIYDAQGNEVFTMNSTYDKIETAGSGYFIVTKKDKKGLLDSAGKVAVPVQYDAIGTSVNGMISLLKGTRFGAFDVNQRILFPPAYDKNLQRFDKNFVIAYKDGAYGFIDNRNKPSGTFVFREIQPWKDSVALVRQQDGYAFHNVYTGKNAAERIAAIRSIRNSPEEKLLIVSQEGNYGVYSNRKGMVIPVKFTDIVNVGTAEFPMYFTEKHVEEASIFVVIYYNAAGEMLRREVYEQDQYERIYCDKK